MNQFVTRSSAVPGAVATVTVDLQFGAFSWSPGSEAWTLYYEKGAGLY